MATTKPMDTKVLEIIIQQELDKNIDFIELPKFKDLLPKLTDEQKELVYKMYVEHFYDVEYYTETETESHWFTRNLEYETEYIKYRKLNNKWSILQPYEIDVDGGQPAELRSSLKKVYETHNNISGKLGGASKCLVCEAYMLKEQTGVCRNCAETWKDSVGNLHKIENIDNEYSHRGFDAQADQWYLIGTSIADDVGKYEKAIKCFDRALELHQNYFNDYNYYKDGYYDVLNSKGLCLENLGRTEDAVKCYNDVIISDANCSGVVWWNKGRILEGLNKLDDALKCYKKFLTIDSSNEASKSTVEDLESRLKIEKYDYNAIQLLKDMSDEELYSAFKDSEHKINGTYRAERFFRDLAFEFDEKVLDFNIYKIFRDFVENMNESSANKVIATVTQKLKNGEFGNAAENAADTAREMCLVPFHYLYYKRGEKTYTNKPYAVQSFKEALNINAKDARELADFYLNNFK